MKNDKDATVLDSDGITKDDIWSTLLNTFPFLKQFLRSDGEAKTLLHKYVLEALAGTLFTILPHKPFRHFALSQLPDPNKLPFVEDAINHYKVAEGPNMMLVQITANPRLDLKKTEEAYARIGLRVKAMFAPTEQDKIPIIDGVSTGDKLYIGDIPIHSSTKLVRVVTVKVPYNGPLRAAARLRGSLESVDSLRHADPIVREFGNVSRNRARSLA